MEPTWNGVGPVEWEGDSRQVLVPCTTSRDRRHAPPSSARVKTFLAAQLSGYNGGFSADTEHMEWIMGPHYKHPGVAWSHTEEKAHNAPFLARPAWPCCLAKLGEELWGSTGRWPVWTPDLGNCIKCCCASSTFSLLAATQRLQMVNKSIY